MLKADVTIMPFAKLYSLLVAKAERKGRTWEEMDQGTSWLTGYTLQELSQLEQVLSRVMRKFVCRLWLNEVSRQ